MYLLPKYTYNQCIQTDSTDPQWSPTAQKYCTANDDSYMSPVGNLQIATSVGNQQITNNWCYVGKEQIAIPNQWIASNSWPDQVWPPAHHPPNSRVSAVKAELMTVEQTAGWVLTLGRFNGWKEAQQYSDSFKRNDIWGYLLQKLTLDSLKNELDITKYGHRLGLMMSIKRLYPDISEHEVETETMSSDHYRSPMSVSEASPVHSPDMYNKNQYDAMSTGGHRASPLSSLEQYEPIKEIAKWTTTEKRPKATQLPPTETLHFTMRGKTTRAGPNNPIIYKVLRKVKIRSGKSVHSDFVGHLSKGSVVVINQMKGRSGRVVLQQHDGEFIKVGWVTMYTYDRQQLLEKYNAKKAGGKVETMETTL